MLSVGISAGHGLVDKSLVQARSNTVDMMDNASALPHAHSVSNSRRQLIEID
jgi:hypothetical protein